MVKVYTPEFLHENPEIFIKLMEEYNISPKELGIKPAYKSQIKTGRRKPSLELCRKLLQLVNEKRRPDPSLGRLRGLSDLTANPNVAGLTSGFDMRPGVARPLWPGRAAVVLIIVLGVLSFTVFKS